MVYQVQAVSEQGTILPLFYQNMEVPTSCYWPPRGPECPLMRRHFPRDVGSCCDCQGPGSGLPLKFTSSLSIHLHFVTHVNDRIFNVLLVTKTSLFQAILVECW